MPGAEETAQQRPAGRAALETSATIGSMILAGVRNRWRRRQLDRAYRGGGYGETPARLALILCNPRSGSTWLYDALRCHPAISVHPRYTFFAALGCLGRRYPRDLASAAADAVQIEVTPGCWCGLPDLAVGHPAVDLPPFAVEKLHPQFFHHADAQFLRRLTALEERALVRLIYLVRAPEAALTSFLRYKERQPDWLPYIAPAAAPGLMRQTYRSMLHIARRRPGLIVDYDDLVERFSETLVAVFRHLWPDAADAWGDLRLAAAISGATARERRPVGPGAFLDRSSGTGGGAESAYRELFAAARGDLAACDRAYRELQQLAGPRCVAA